MEIYGSTAKVIPEENIYLSSGNSSTTSTEKLIDETWYIVTADWFAHEWLYVLIAMLVVLILIVILLICIFMIKRKRQKKRVEKYKILKGDMVTMTTAKELPPSIHTVSSRLDKNGKPTGENVPLIMSGVSLNFKKIFQ